MAHGLKIFACTRTMNESRNIDRFCQSFAWADRILVGDGGSTDDTITKAEAYPNVTVRAYPIRNVSKGVTWNPQGPMCQWLWDWARKDGADWVVEEDCDSVPNTKLRTEMRSIIEANNAKVDMIGAARLYQWGTTRSHFPQLAHVGKTGPWAVDSYFTWRASLTNFKFNDDPVHQGWVPDPKEAKVRLMTLMPPYCFIHRFALDEDDIEKKTKSHDAGVDYKVQHQHPLQFGGPLTDMPEWATEDE
jgi:glycosyltransferase involved in cell wall biosynthesis